MWEFYNMWDFGSNVWICSLCCSKFTKYLDCTWSLLCKAGTGSHIQGWVVDPSQASRHVSDDKARMRLFAASALLWLICWLSSLWKFRERPEVQTYCELLRSTGCTAHLHNCSTGSGTAQRFQRKAGTRSHGERPSHTLKHGNEPFTLKKMTHTMFPLIHLTVTDLLQYVKSFVK